MALKIIKHCQEEGAGGTDLVQGVLLGLVEGNRLEVTNCFPFPRHTEDDEFDEGQCPCNQGPGTRDRTFSGNFQFAKIG